MLPLVADSVLEHLRPLWEAADKAFRDDAAYAIEVAQAGASLKSRQDRSVAVCPAPGV